MTAQTSPQPNVPAEPLSAKTWLLLLATGAGAGLAGGLLMRLLRLVQHLSFHYTHGDFLDGVQQASPERRVVALVLAGLLAGPVLYGLKRLRPGAGGHGLSEAIWCNHGQIATGSTLVKALLSIVTVGMGVALGREGALKDTGAVFANKLADGNRFWSRISPEHRRLLAACGAGAGMAAAYNVPLGGALFAAEVLLGSLTLGNVLPAFAASFTGVAVSWLLLPNEPAYTFPELQATHSLVLWSLLIGPLFGLVSVGYVRAIGWAQTHKPQGWRLAVMPVAIFTLLGAASMRFPQLLGNGKNIVQLTFASEFPVGLLLCLIVLRPLATVLCLRSGAPGGLFTPTMTAGALLGDGAGRLWNHVLPANDAASCALIGSAALLSAATLGPLSSAAFLLELTRHADSLMVPLLIATTGATVTARALEIRSIYSVQ